ncbi:MAG: serine/threonine-protein kinase [Candidatus Sumerlaeia bacterium]|nr:serine/threonine-protein kinase [Candidatus Sumerlaeia bacterium]
MKRFFRAHNYDLLGELGRGGMGIVYLAQDIKLGRRVALKTLSPERKSKQNSLLRFEREARTFAAIRHPHIANLYEFSDEGDYQFLALEYIEGTDLETERRTRRKYSPLETAIMIRNLADALDHTHGLGIMHRDIKPGNILIEHKTNRVVLTDFGLAKSNNDITLTASGYAVGTPAYMAPEQISDQFGSKPDGRADLFSLGTVAYEMLTGKHPFLGSDDMATMRAIVQRQPQPMQELEPSIPHELDRVITQMLEKNPSRRPANGKVVVELMQAIIAGGSGSSPASRMPSSSPVTPGLPAQVSPIQTPVVGASLIGGQTTIPATAAPAAQAPGAAPSPVATPAPQTGPQQPPSPSGRMGGFSTKEVVLLCVMMLGLGVIITAIVFIMFTG